MLPDVSLVPVGPLPVRKTEMRQPVLGTDANAIQCFFAILLSSLFLTNIQYIPVCSKKQHTLVMVGCLLARRTEQVENIIIRHLGNFVISVNVMTGKIHN